jgi:RNA recognition motif-containing protein
MNIYVGNLPYSVTEEAMRTMFEQYGEVISAKLVMDRETGRMRGFGFVEMDNTDADAAIKALNKMELDGRQLKINQAEPRKSSPSRSRW